MSDLWNTLPKKKHIYMTYIITYVNEPIDQCETTEPVLLLLITERQS